MLRNIGAAVVGLAAGMAVNMLFVMLTGSLYSMPEGLDFTDQTGMAKFMATLLVTAFLIIFLAHLGQPFVGAWVGLRISENKIFLVTMIVGILSLTGGIINMMSMPLPSWMMIELPLYLVVAWGAAQLEIRRRSS